MRLGLSLGYAPPGTNPTQLVALAEEAERLGFDSAWAAEAWGTDAVTVLAYGTMLHVARAAVEELGVDAEVIDLRSIVPVDIETITRSVEKTGRCVIAHEATRTCGFGAELSALVQEHCLYHLEAPIVRVTGWDTPYPHAFEWAYFPGPKRVADGIRRALEG